MVCVFQQRVSPSLCRRGSKNAHKEHTYASSALASFFFCSFVLQTHFMNWVMLKTIRWDWFPGHKQEDKEEQMRRHGLWNENSITTTKDSI